MALGIAAPHFAQQALYHLVCIALTQLGDLSPAPAQKTFKHISGLVII
jgi:hypothetical protein